MLKLALAVCLLAAVYAQFPTFGTGGMVHTIDTIHELRVQYDDEHNIIIFVGRTDCYIVEATAEATYDALVASTTALHTFTETVYNSIQAGTGVTDITQQAAADYHSRLEQWECRNKHIHKVAYTAA